MELNAGIAFASGLVLKHTNLTEGDVPWVEVMKALKEIGYKSSVTAEMMPPRPTLLDLTSTAMDWILSL